MHYFALLLGPETAEEPDASTQAQVMSAYEDFHAKFGSAIRAGDALVPSATEPGSPVGQTRRSSPTARLPRRPKWPAATTSSRRRILTTH